MSVELSALRRDGTSFPVELAIARFDAGGTRHITAFICDISERTESQQALRDSEERFRLLVESVKEYALEAGTAEEAIEALGRAPRRGDSPGARLTPAHVLVVEDDCDIEVAEHGAAALDLLRTGPAPLLILLDLLMPVMNGWQLLDELRGDARLAAVPVVVLSASDVPSGPGVASWLRKPYEVDALLAIIADQLRSSASRAAARHAPG